MGLSTMSSFTQLVVLALVGVVAAERQPKLFYVSSTSTTSTVSTTTLCYISSNLVMANTCTGRRKRRMVQDDTLLATDSIRATSVDEQEQDDVIRSNDAGDAGEDRKGKFLLYWMTTTSTSTTTTFTSTPSGFTISNCSG